MPHFILSALGSYGDVHPLVGLGSALAARGHRVQVIANPYFADVATSGGVEFLPVGTRQQYIELSQHPDLWHPLRGPALALRHAAGGLARPLYELALAHYATGETVFGAHPLDLGTRVAAEKLHAPLAAIDLAPSMLWSVYDSPRLKGALVGPGTPKWLKHAQYWLSDMLFIRRILGGPLNELRRDAGLAPVKHIFAQWLHRADLVLGLFPEWFGPRQPDWPANTKMAGFPLWDTPATAPLLPAVVHEFLTADDPPIAFSPGSANRAAHSFFAAAVEACQILGRRGLLLTKYDHQLPPNLPDGVRHFGFLPLSRVLPRMAALVHHGGIGTCAQALAAAVPQVVRPMSFDQFDNARRLVRLGVAEELPVKKSNGPAFAGILARVLSSPQIAANGRKYAVMCNGRMALDSACVELERLAATSTAR